RSHGFTLCEEGRLPLIVLHPSLVRPSPAAGADSRAPWDLEPDCFGLCLAFDALLHECIHLSVRYRLDCSIPMSGFESHNNPAWVGEVNRLMPCLGLDVGRAGMSRVVRVPRETHLSAGVRQRNATEVKRIADGDLPFSAVAGFPHSLRGYMGDFSF